MSDYCPTNTEEHSEGLCSCPDPYDRPDDDDYVPPPAPNRYEHDPWAGGVFVSSSALTRAYQAGVSHADLMQIQVEARAQMREHLRALARMDEAFAGGGRGET